ncbi:BLUF domain-containing protein [Alishewanella sp. d11]|uniref:BLUF domain-containing protein n=1 Tax=Alishewanella sp. d11 TaxID=3414030 RepID=UPI003BF8580C
MLQYQIVYYSTATREFSEQDLIELLSVANKYNNALGITGCLVYSNGKFIQLLEGERKNVLELFEKIKRDPRHNNVTVTVEMTVNQKLFPDWGMAFKFLEKDVLKQYGVKDPSKWIYSEFNAEASPGKEAIFNFAVRNKLMQSQVLPR